MSNKPTVGVSACLLGRPVRYNGDQCRHEWVTDELSDWVKLRPLCPEVEMGLGVPRPAMKLEKRSRSVRMIVIKSGEDKTELAHATIRKLLKPIEEWHGFILKKSSPSCGLERVKLYSGTGSSRVGTGLFAQGLRDQDPLLPLIEEGRLSDPVQREHFIEQVYAYFRLKSVEASASDLQRLHRQYKLILMSHSPKHYQALGRIVANSARKRPREVLAEYGPLFMQALLSPATRGRRANALDHAFGYFKKRLSAVEKAQIHQVVADYRAGLIPLSSPLTLLEFLIRSHGEEYLEDQLFLNPYPRALALQNAI